MPQINSTRIGEAVRAIQTKNALEQVELRNSGDNSTTSQASSGPRIVSSAQSTQASPLFDQNGNLFTGGSVTGNNSQAFTIGPGAKKGTVISYKKDNKVKYAVLQKKTKGVRPKGFKVKDVSSSDLKKIQQKHPDTKIVVVDQQQLQQFDVQKSHMLEIFDALDPSETIFMKMLTKSLMGNIFESESVGDMFLILYFRFMVIAGIIILISYLLFSVYA